MLSSLLRGGILDWIYQTLVMIPGIILGLSFHEYAHAYVADRCGDPTPRYMGRVTLDPRSHVDWFGLISLALIHFGWGKPVVVNPYNFKNRRRDSILVGIAGITTNCAIATVLGLALRVVMFSDATVIFFSTNAAGRIIFDLWFNTVVINFSLMLFNLIPVPPLDGFGIVSEIFNLKKETVWQFIYKNSMIILILFILFDIPSLLLTRPLSFLVNIVCFGVF
ncbi:MAG: site-2 protease family protein [Bacillota bacterium]|nr:site-2 protease family protein [Bacillota bacterium]